MSGRPATVLVRDCARGEKRGGNRLAAMGSARASRPVSQRIVLALSLALAVVATLIVLTATGLVPGLTAMVYAVAVLCGVTMALAATDGLRVLTDAGGRRGALGATLRDRRVSVVAGVYLAAAAAIGVGLFVIPFATRRSPGVMWVLALGGAAAYWAVRLIIRWKAAGAARA